MLTMNEALQRVLSAVRPPLGERVPLTGALGRVLVETVRSPLNVPPWNNSAMDGFAVLAADTQPGGPPLRVLETIGAGVMPTQTVTAGSCSRIMTGAPMPDGADSVVMIEQTDQWGPEGALSDDSGVVRILKPAREGQNIRPMGGDVRRDQVVLEPGSVLGAGELGLLSSLGMPSVLVAQRPRVAVLSTGDEVVEPGWPIAAGQIYSSNTIALMSLLWQAGAEPVHCGIAPDEPEGLRAALQRCLRSDLVLTTGGVSVGDFDYVKDVFDDVGATLDFWKVAMQPGKPLAFGSISGIPVFGLPGNPVSCMVNFLQFVRPVVRGLLGDPNPHLPVVTATLTAPVRKRVGRAMLARVVLKQVDGQLQATPTRTQSSGVLMSMVQGDGLTLLPASSGPCVSGDAVQVQVLRWSWMNRREPVSL